MRKIKFFPKKSHKSLYIHLNVGRHFQVLDWLKKMNGLEAFSHLLQPAQRRLKFLLEVLRYETQSSRICFRHKLQILVSGHTLRAICTGSQSPALTCVLWCSSIFVSLLCSFGGILSHKVSLVLFSSRRIPGNFIGTHVLYRETKWWLVGFILKAFCEDCLRDTD